MHIAVRRNFGDRAIARRTDRFTRNGSTREGDAINRYRAFPRKRRKRKIGEKRPRALARSLLGARVCRLSGLFRRQSLFANFRSGAFNDAPRRSSDDRNLLHCKKSLSSDRGTEVQALASLLIVFPRARPLSGRASQRGCYRSTVRSFAVRISYEIRLGVTNRHLPPNERGPAGAATRCNCASRS